MNLSLELLFLIFFPMLGALVCYLVGKKSKKIRDILANAVTIIEFGSVVFFVVYLLGMMISYYKSFNMPLSIAEIGANLDVLETDIPLICGFGLKLKFDGFRAVYAIVVAFMWMMVTLLCPEYFVKYRNRNRFYAFLLVTLGATMGVFLSRDFYTTFIFFEVMSLTSYVWVAHDEKKESLRAAETYLGISILGGLVMLMGIFMLYDALGTTEFSGVIRTINESYLHGVLNGEIIAAGICIAFGFAVKAGAFPVHIWLPKAHPVAPAPASALLSGVLTKTGIFGIIVVTIKIFADVKGYAYTLMAIAVATMLLGAILAIFSTNLKKVLACSSLSQIGFILTGVAVYALSGLKSDFAARGAFIYMVNHSLLKLVLFMAAGVIFMNIHKLELEDIKGFGRKKPLLNAVFLCGVLGISGIPLFNGYIGKTLIHEAIVEVAGVPSYVEPCFLLAGGCTLCYMLKLYICIFVEKNNDDELQAKYDEMTKYWKLPSKIALVGSAIMLPIIGVVPNTTAKTIMDIGQSFFNITHAEPIEFFALHNMKGSIISIFIGLLLYVGIVKVLLTAKEGEKDVYKDYWPKWLDLENLIYRPVIVKFLPFIFGIICRVLDSLVDGSVVLLRKTFYRDRELPYEKPEGNPITNGLAAICSFVVKVINKFFRKNKTPITVDFEHKFAMKWTKESENKQIIERSLSYGLLLFCTGLVLTVGYLLYVVLH